VTVKVLVYALSYIVLLSAGPALGAELVPRDVESIQSLLQRADKQVDKLSGGCRPDPSGGSELATGARRVMATTYQSCSVLELPPYQPETDPVIGIVQDKGTGKRKVTSASSLVTSHYYLRTVPNPPPPGCRDPRVPPTVYSFGAKPSEWLYRKSGSLDLFSDLSKKDFCEGSGYECGGLSARGMDCSGFVLTSMLSSGLNIAPGIEPPFGGTAVFAAAATTAGSCFKQVPLTPMGQSLNEGDLFLVEGVHVVVIDSVGADPFGIRKAKTCDEIDPLNFDFRILQSSPTGGQIGVNRMEARDYFGGLAQISEKGGADIQAPLAFLGPMLLRARTVCREMRGEVLNYSAVSDKAKSAFSKSHFLRHSGESVTGCVKPESKRPKLSGEECIAGCELSG
jgi:hypothetical protein